MGGSYPAVLVAPGTCGAGGVTFLRDKTVWLALLLAVACGLFPAALLAFAAPANAAPTYVWSGISVSPLGETSTVEATITGPEVSTVEITGTLPAVSIDGTPVVSLAGTMPPVSLDVAAWGLAPDDVQWGFMLLVYFGGVSVGRFLY